MHLQPFSKNPSYALPHNLDRNLFSNRYHCHLFIHTVCTLHLVNIFQLVGGVIQPHVAAVEMLLYAFRRIVVACANLR